MTKNEEFEYYYEQFKDGDWTNFPSFLSQLHRAIEQVEDKVKVMSDQIIELHRMILEMKKENEK